MMTTLVDLFNEVIPFRRLFQFFHILFHHSWKNYESMIAQVLKRYEHQEEMSFYKERAFSGLDTAEKELIAASKLSEESRILVMGSGTGRECFHLEKSGYEVYGQDESHLMLCEAQAIAKQIKSTVIFFKSLDEIPVHTKFDLIFFTPGFLNHIPGRKNRINLLKQLKQYLKEDGKIATFLDEFKFKLIHTNAIASILLRIRFTINGMEWNRGDTIRNYLGNHSKINMPVFFHYYQNKDEFKNEVTEGKLIPTQVSHWGWILSQNQLI